MYGGGSGQIELMQMSVGGHNHLQQPGGGVDRVNSRLVTINSVEGMSTIVCARSRREGTQSSIATDIPAQTTRLVNES